jgi:sialic acid synthase SpsE
MLDGYEADVAIPSLKLAIEWNGIVHFKPIYSQTKLDKIQTRDVEKLKIASNKDINLIVIPDLVSNDKILKQAFNDVKVIINNLLNNT